MIDAILLDSDTTVLHIFDASTGGSINAGSGRSGGNSLRISSNGQSCTKNIGSNLGSLNVGFGWSPSSLASIGASGLVYLTDAGTAQVSLKVLSDGTIQAYRGAVGTLLGATSPGAITAGVYQHIEFAATISATVGTVQVWVNGASVLNLT